MTTMTLTENPLAKLAAEVRRQKQSRRDLIASTQRVTLAEPEGDPDGTAVLLDMPEGVEEFGVTRHAHQQIAETVKVPFRTYDRLLGKHPDLLAHLVNGLFVREPLDRMIRVLDGNVRAVLSDRYRPRDNAELLEHLLPVLGEFPGIHFKRCDLTETRLYIKTYLPGTERRVEGLRRGDIVRFGVVISNSEVGSGSLYVYPYSDVLACTNGMIHEKFGQRRVHLGKRIEATDEAYELYSDETIRLDDAAFFAKCADTVRGCLSEAVFDALTAQMQDLAGMVIEKPPVEQIKVLADRHALTGEESDSILKYLIEGGDLSGWGYVNAITATARSIDPDRQTELETLAGRLTAEPAWAE